jgi:hypothetical protein
VLHCDCGFEVRGPHEEALVAEIRRHAWGAHGMALSHEEALALALRAGLDDSGSMKALRETTTRTDKEER